MRRNLSFSEDSDLSCDDVLERSSQKSKADVSRCYVYGDVCFPCIDLEFWLSHITHLLVPIDLVSESAGKGKDKAKKRGGKREARQRQTRKAVKENQRVVKIKKCWAQDEEEVFL